MRFGLTWDQATRFVDRLRRRVTVENDFRYPQADSAGIERWDLFFRRQRPRRGEFCSGMCKWVADVDRFLG